MSAEQVRSLSDQADQATAARMAELMAENASLKERVEEQEKKIEELRAMQDDAASKLEKLRHASDDAWLDIKKGTDRSWELFNAALKSAASRFK